MFRVIHVFQRNCIKNSFHHGQTVDAFSSYGKSAFFSESCVEGKTGLNHTHGVCVCATYCANETEIIKEKKRKGNSLSISYFYLLSRDALLLSKIDAIDATKSTLSFEVRISTIYFFFLTFNCACVSIECHLSTFYVPLFGNSFTDGTRSRHLTFFSLSLTGICRWAQHLSASLFKILPKKKREKKTLRLLRFTLAFFVVVAPYSWTHI